MSQPILITGAAGGPQGSTGRLIAELLLKQAFPFALSSINSTHGPINSANKVRKSWKAISSIRPQSRRR